MLMRPLLVACVIGTALSIGATGTVSLGLVAATTASWSFVVLVQLGAAAVIILTAPGRRLPTGQAVDAFFTLHVPWSAWILSWAAWTWTTPSSWRFSDLVLSTTVVPAVWTALLVYRFCRDVLGEPHRLAVVRTCLHQFMVWGAFLIIAGAVVGLWPRLLNVLG